ncbi:MAG: DUF72 domain-containing protein [Candidatus Aenigmatarchaeota archaeon]
MISETESNIKIGTCGYGYYDPREGWKDEYESKLQAYTDEYETVEINKTFYKLPMVRTAERWKENAFDDFDFNMKGWQALTHPTWSPTWRNKKDRLSEAQKENFGYLRPNEEVIEAWEDTKNIAQALRSSVVVIQTPGSFDYTDENERNARKFFDRVERGNIEMGWEPRGDWKENPEKVKEICDEHDLIHIVDVMRRDPLSQHPAAYIRLHGLNTDEYDYDYDYSDEELHRLAEKLEELGKDHDKVYCMFNNYEMFKNSKRLKEIL